MFPTFIFGPWILENSFISSLERKAFAIELTDNRCRGLLILDEKISDEEIYWQDLYKVGDIEAFNADFWNVYVNTQYLESLKVTSNELYLVSLNNNFIDIHPEIFDQLLSLNKEYCGVISNLNTYLFDCASDFKMKQTLLF